MVHADAPMALPPDDDARFPLARISNLALAAALAFTWLALRRYATYHNETFDLAFYTRMAWGMGRGDYYHPITNSYMWGLHASPVLYPFGWLSRLHAPLVPLLLAAQAASTTAAAIPLARIAARRIGLPVAADIMAVAYLLYPPIATIATYEFHPGSLALFPLAMALDRADRRDLRGALPWLAAAAVCREDAALVAGLVGLAGVLNRRLARTQRAWGVGAFAALTTYFAVYFLVIAPSQLPRHGSLELHFGHTGANTPAGLVVALFTHPVAMLRTMLVPVKVLYGVRLLAPVAFLPVLAPRWLLPALVPFAINMVSQFPAAPQIHSHYSTLISPFVFAAAAHGAGRLAAGQSGPLERNAMVSGLAVLAASLVIHHRAGATPLSRRWSMAPFRRDARTAEIDSLLRLLPPDASVAAPDAMLAHVAERPLFQRFDNQRRPCAWIVADVGYRTRFGTTQNILRNTEEGPLRVLLAGARYGVFASSPSFLLFRQHWSARAYGLGRYVRFDPDPGVHRVHVPIGPSVHVAGWKLERVDGRSELSVLLHARRRWPPDVGFEVGWGPVHESGARWDPEHTVTVLPFDGRMSPTLVHVGEVARTRFVLPVPHETLRGQTVYLGFRRVDGSRMDFDSPNWTPLELSATPEGPR